jgi:hypothetical protein
MDYTINRIFIPLGSLVTTGDTSTLTTQQIGFYNPNTFQALSAYNVDQLLVAFGSGVDKWGSFKSSKIKEKKVINFTKSVANTSSQQQITWIGWDGVSDATAPVFKCDEEYIITFLIREYYSRGIYQPLIRESVRIKTSCCNECSSNCDALDCHAFMQSAVDQINNNPLLSKYLVAELVSDCTGTEGYYTYTLTVPTPADVAAYQTSIEDFYAGCIGSISYVTGTENTTFTVNPASVINTVTSSGTAAAGTASYTAVTGTTSGGGSGATFNVSRAGGTYTVTVVDGGIGYSASDTITILGTSLGGTAPTNNLTITVATLSVSESCGLSTFDAFDGILWEEVYVEGTGTCKCGIKVTGNALDEFGTPCIPDAVPYVANLVRFHAVVHEGPYNTQDFDIEQECDAWSVITTQEIAYSIGDSSAMAERERHYFRYNLPGMVWEAGYYWNPIYNNDTVLYSDPTATYTVYRIEYYIDEPKGFEKKWEYTEAVEIWVDSTNSALAASIETALETFTGILV